MSKLKYLTSKYKSIRKTRPDGNCFFRAFAYAYLEYLVKNKDDYEPFRALSEESKDRLIQLGFPQFTLEDFHDTVSDKINSIFETIRRVDINFGIFFLLCLVYDGYPTSCAE